MADDFILEDPSGSLNDRQKLFCHYYITEKFNGTQAAIKAGYAKGSANEQAARLLANDSISTYVDKLKEDLGLRLGISRERVALELAKIGFFDIRKIYNDEGGLMNIKDVDDDSAGAIAGIESFEEFEGYGTQREKTGDVRKVKIWDKRAALADLNKMLGYNEPEKNETTFKIGKDLADEFTD